MTINKYQYGSHSGVDMKALFDGQVIGTLQGISFSTQREKAFLYTMGSPDPRSVSRGKRAIAGSLVFLQFDSEPILERFGNINDKTRQKLFLSDKDDLRPEYTSGLGTGLTSVGTSANSPGAPIGSQEQNLTSVGSDQQAAVPWMPDQIPPFDIVLVSANEYGSQMSMRLIGCEITSNGYGVSVDDIVSEHSYSFICLSLVPWTNEGIHTDMQ